MNVLIIGTGGREAALAWKLAQSPLDPKIYMDAGNDGLKAVAQVQPIGDVLAFCRDHGIDFVVVGPEGPLLEGVADKLREAGIPVFGPSAAAAQLEGSKFFTRTLCAEIAIPSPRWQYFEKKSAALSYTETETYPLVIKADGLAAGKGVVIAENKAQAQDAVEDIFDGKFGAPSLLMEEFMEGEEASFFVLSDGTHALPFGWAQDHKRAFDGDKGPNTGGMGAFSPAAIRTDVLEAQVMAEIILPTLALMKQRGTPFVGVLYAGLMVKDAHAKLVEFNVRFGDPECQILMMRLESDLLPILLACAQGRLSEVEVNWRTDAAALIVMAAKGYPRSYKKGTKIKGLKEAEQAGGQIFSAAVLIENGVCLANGGRVLNIAALGKDLTAACHKAYAAAKHVDWQEGFYRTDIGKKYSTGKGE